MLLTRGPPQLEELVVDPEGRSVWAYFFGETTWFVPWSDFLSQMESESLLHWNVKIGF